VKILKSAALAIILSCLSLSAQAMAIGYNFDYTFLSGEILSGMLVGELQGDDDTVLVDSISMVSYTGSPATIFNEGLLGPNTVSLSGSVMNFVTAAPTPTLGGFEISTGAFDVALVAGPDISILENETYSAARWNLVAKSLPEPGTLSLLAIGLVGIAWVRRRKIA